MILQHPRAGMISGARLSKNPPRDVQCVFKYLIKKDLYLK
jgi:hypothetical protein